MATYYYSTQPFLAWCINHYFYQKTHYVWVAAPFYPYRERNPRSSNPYLIYQDFYQPWKDRDIYSSYLNQQRRKLIEGISKQSLLTDKHRISRLKIICDRINIAFFYPLVYRVDVDAIASKRLDNTQGSAADVDSSEFLIADLQEDEFDLLFADIDQAITSQSFLQLWAGVTDTQTALSLLESECTS